MSEEVLIKVVGVLYQVLAVAFLMGAVFVFKPVIEFVLGIAFHLASDLAEYSRQGLQ